MIPLLFVFQFKKRRDQDEKIFWAAAVLSVAAAVCLMPLPARAEQRVSVTDGSKSVAAAKREIASVKAALYAANGISFTANRAAGMNNDESAVNSQTAKKRLSDSRSYRKTTVNAGSGYTKAAAAAVQREDAAQKSDTADATGTKGSISTAAGKKATGLNKNLGNLPTDNRLCLVVLGFTLNPDGTMPKELIGRLEKLKSIAEKYPQAVIVCTGGCTSEGNHSISEAGVMAD